MNLSRIIERWAEHFPDKPALHFHGSDISYAALWGEIKKAANSLDVRKGDRVAWLGYNSPEMLVLLFALARRGAILVPLNWRLTAAEHKAILADCSPKWLFHDADFAVHARSLEIPIQETKKQTQNPVEGKDEDDALIVYTSGTTGKPKGAVLTQSALLWNGFNSIHAHDLRQSDHVLTALPMFHVGGLNNQTLPALLAGASVTLHKRFDPALWLEDVAKRKPTLSLLVPATMQAVIGHPAWKSTNLSSLRMLNCGSMVVPDSLIRAFHARGVPVGQIYGCTETAPIATVLLREDAERKLGSAGKPAPHCEVKLVEGEVWVRGPNVMRGYWNDPAGSAAALTPEGWFRTGDLARIDEDGFYWIMGRSKDVIISGGENVYPAELENVLADCPEIAECAVLGVEDEKWGEAAVACVVLRSGSSLTEDRVKTLFNDRLARFKHPRRVIFLESLPRNAMGKVQKFELKQKLRELS
ncbi:MAG TPA: long-chain fatty acid--CoA ligase [Burkholderiales bacterium]|nr:long-chain fatty acid--CoA ligase [Burkholderiales bacterium]